MTRSWFTTVLHKLNKLPTMASPSSEPFVDLLVKISCDDSDTGWTTSLSEFCASNVDSFVLEVKSKETFLLLLLNKVRQISNTWNDSHCERKHA